MRISSLPENGWSSKITELNPALYCTIRINRPIGSPEQRWEDEVNEYLKPEESEETRGIDLNNNST